MRRDDDIERPGPLAGGTGPEALQDSNTVDANASSGSMPDNLVAYPGDLASRHALLMARMEGIAEELRTSAKAPGPVDPQVLQALAIIAHQALLEARWGSEASDRDPGRLALRFLAGDPVFGKADPEWLARDGTVVEFRPRENEGEAR